MRVMQSCSDVLLGEAQVEKRIFGVLLMGKYQLDEKGYACFADAANGLFGSNCLRHC